MEEQRRCVMEEQGEVCDGGAGEVCDGGAGEVCDGGEGGTEVSPWGQEPLQGQRSYGTK